MSSTVGENWLRGMIRNRPKSRPYACPAGSAPCSQRCFLRHMCASRPDQIKALTDRLNVEAERAMVEYLQRLRH